MSGAMATNDHSCAQRVFSSARWDVGGHLCMNRATVEEDGQWWCKRHAPSRAAEREEAEREEVRRRADAARSLRELAQARAAQLSEQLGTQVVPYPVHQRSAPYGISHWLMVVAGEGVPNESREDGEAP